MLFVDGGSFVLPLNKIGSGLCWAQTWLNPPTCGHSYPQPLALKKKNYDSIENYEQRIEFFFFFLKAKQRMEYM